MVRHTLIAVALLLVSVADNALALSVRIKDITTFEGERNNVIEGVGLVAGLSGTGGRTPFTRQSLTNVLARFGNRYEPLLRSGIFTNAQLKTDNVSLVLISAELPVNSVPGQRIDVTVSALDDAKSLLGGVLAQTTLVGVDGVVYATASGNLSLGGGFSYSGQGASANKAHATTGRIAGGAVVEMSTPIDVSDSTCLRLLLMHPDRTTAQRIADAINEFAPDTAECENNTVVSLRLPADIRERGRYLASISELRVEPDQRAVVTINDRTGTVVIGHNVRLSGVALSHGSLTIVTSENPTVSQPAPFSQGETTTVPRTDIEVIEEKKPITVINETATVTELADAMTALGVSPGDMSAIFQQLHAQGALQADLILQ